VVASILTPSRRKRALLLQVTPLFLLVPSVAFCANTDTPAVRANQPSEPDAVQAAPSRTLVIGFLGGFVRHDDAVHSTVQVAHNLQRDFAPIVRVATFENRRIDDAFSLILHFLGHDHEGMPTEEEKRDARIILYGHSWGASAVVTLARHLEAQNIPVLLTIQVDSVSKGGQNDSVIPGNVRQAANFYQDQGWLRGQPLIRAAKTERTAILGNFRFDYSTKPISCPQYPWYDRVFMRSHIEIECDPVVWHRVEDLIRGQLPAGVADQTSVK
jgi:hypothetical protein